MAEKESEGTTRITTRKIFLDEDPNQENAVEYCPECLSRGESHVLRYMFINLDLAIFKCSSRTCMYPHTDFKYKNTSDKTIYRHEILSSALPVQPYPSVVDDVEIDDLLHCLKPKPEVLPVGVTKDEHAAIAVLESELDELLSDHLNQPEPPGNDFNSLFGSPKIPKTRTKTFPTPEKPLLKQEKCDTIDPPAPKRRKLSKAYEFLRQLNGQGDFKVPSTPGKSPNKRTSSHPKTQRSPRGGSGKEASRAKSPSQTYLKEFSSSFLRKIEYSSIQTPSHIIKYEMVTNGNDHPHIFVKYVSNTAMGVDLSRKIKAEPT